VFLLQFHINNFKPLNAALNPICHSLALLGAHHILHISRVRVNIPSTMGLRKDSVTQLTQWQNIVHVVF